ncbi:hypothetical protein NTE17_004113 [Vibrio fluvialis]|nr:hypothetical protein [Vibrio fluvialis]ELO4019673.1 hypothetical protein [Vibrio fluvialis]
MTQLLQNEELLNDLQQTVDDAWILEQAAEILAIVDTLEPEEFEQLHDTDDRPVVRVYRTADGFKLNSVAYDMDGDDLKTYFRFSDYESGFSAVDGEYDYEAVQERRERIRTERQVKKQRKEEQSLERFLRIEKAYQTGTPSVAHPYLERKGIEPESVQIEYRVVHAPLFQTDKSLMLLIYKLSDNAYQVITPSKLTLNGKLQDKFNIIRELGALKGAFATVGNGEPEFIVEGFADAISANMCLDRPVAIGLNAGNIKNIAANRPELILIGDNDDAGRKSAEQSSLDALFPISHKDIDEMRQDIGIDATKAFLEAEIERIEQDRAPLLCDSQRSMTLVSAPPGSGKSRHESLRILHNTGLTIYAVHNKQAMSQHNDSRVTMLRGLARHESVPLPEIRTVKSEDAAETIKLQFEKAVEEYRSCEDEDKNWVIFITHKALSMLNFELDGLDARLVIDEVPDAFQTHIDKMQADNLGTLLSYFNAESKEVGDYYIVNLNDLNETGRRFYYNKSNKYDLGVKSYWSFIDQTLRNANHTNFLIIEKGTGAYADVAQYLDVDIETLAEGESPYISSTLSINPRVTITKCELFNAEVFDNFADVRMLSDDCENSIFALLLERIQGVEMNIERLPTRHERGIAHRITQIIGITDQVFSKHKMDTRPELSNAIAEELTSHCNLFASLWLLNNESRENSDAINKLKVLGYNVEDLNPMTHGRNDLTHYDTLIMMYSLKPSPVYSALMSQLRISREELTRWYEHNVHMQNVFRCDLRIANGTKSNTLVFPDKSSIEYFLDRVEELWGTDERQLIEEKVSYLDSDALKAYFESKPSGRRQSGNEALTGAERTKLSKWRKDLPDLNEFAETLENGLKALVSMKVRQVKALYEEWFDRNKEQETPESVRTPTIELDGYTV